MVAPAFAIGCNEFGLPDESTSRTEDRLQLETELATWMRLALDGDEIAYGQLLETLGGALRGMVAARLSRMGGEAGDVEDVVQETLLAVHLKRHTWRRSELIGPWIAAIARNKLIDSMRRGGRHLHVPLADVEQALFSQADSTGEAHKDVETMLRSLDDRQQRIVRMVSIEGQSCRLAGVTLHMKEGAVRVALHRALKALAAAYRRSPT